uniref:Uncharacterized protein n=1 Tax=Arundo donax TaxID=35708 RepID=A0A0A8Y978_ARUDO
MAHHPSAGRPPAVLPVYGSCGFLLLVESIN